MLETYRKKRDFSKTNEPSGNIEKEDSGFVYMIHKHEASHLHYDLRLEQGGVLKSWAVPKGPSMNPNDKKLAMKVEDHPYDYKDFEGTIPKGEYGGGNVMIWDYGTYEVVGGTGDKKKDEKIIEEKINNGLFSFIIKGKKLNGEFSLVKIKKDSKNSWLLIKKNDDKANLEIENVDLSAKTGRTMKEIEGGSKTVDPQNILKKFKEAKKGQIPKNIKPMLASLVDEPFDGEGWIFEIKWDGYRTITEVENGEVRMYSRNLLSFNKKFMEIVENLRKFSFDVVFDGEVIVFNDKMKPDFGLLQNYENEKKGILVYYIFDILFLDGYNLMDLELIKRKEILKEVIGDFSNVKFSDHFEKNGKEFFELIKKQEMEGIIGKKSASIYRKGDRGKDWVKIKNILTGEAIICGYTRPRGARKGIGALILGVYENGELIYTGHTGGGFSDKQLQDTKKLLDEYVTENCPFKEIPKTNEKPTWLKPELVCEVKFSEITKDGYLRQPVFLGFRADKNASDVVREKPIKKEEVINSSSKKKSSKTEKKLEINQNSEKTYKNENLYKVNLTNLEKIYFPDDNITKGDLIDYYRKIAPIILPHLIDRPESLNRFPNGIYNASFYQKNFELKDLPSWMKSFKVYSDSEQRSVNYMLIKDEESLLFMINLGCIEINPWSSRVENIENPDYVILDLDPEDIDFKEVIKVALTTHEVLESIGIKSFCKTSGATGIHILIPTGAKYSYDQVTEFARLVNILVNLKLPKITSIERRPINRKKMVYLDYLQNRKGQTIASAYSIRPKKGAPISTPLNWNELRSGLRPEDFTMKNIFNRIEKYGDIWKGFLDNSFDMIDAIEKLNELFDKYSRNT